MARARIEVPTDVRAASGVAFAASVYGVLYAVGNWVINGFDLGYLIIPSIVVAACLIWAVVRRRRPSLIVDTEGLDVSGQRIAWSQIRLVWLERSPVPVVRRFAWIKIVTWSLPSLSFAQRSGYLEAKNTGAVWSSRGLADIAALIQGLAPESVEIRTGPGREAFMKRLQAGEESLP